MAEHLAEQTRLQMPSFRGRMGPVAINQLAEDGVDTIAEAAEYRAPTRSRVPLPGRKGRQQGQILPEQLLPKMRRPVVAIAYQYPLSARCKLRDNAQFMDVSRGLGETGNHPRLAQVHVDPEAVESLPIQDILSEGSFSSEPLAAVSSGELILRRRGDREAIHQSKGGIVSHGTQEVLPHLLLDLQEIGGLPGESGSVHSLQARKESPIMLAEIAVQFRVLATAQDFSHRFHSQDLGVRQDRSRTPLAQAFSLKKAVHRVIYQAKDSYYQNVQVPTHLHDK